MMSVSASLCRQIYRRRVNPSLVLMLLMWVLCCAAVMQEGQVIECSQVSDIRVGSPPKVNCQRVFKCKLAPAAASNATFVTEYSVNSLTRSLDL